MTKNVIQFVTYVTHKDGSYDEVDRFSLGKVGAP
jgi:hypothetical protein